jgi:hypothetical protein
MNNIKSAIAEYEHANGLTQSNQSNQRTYDSSFFGFIKSFFYGL